jgi:hypothetical protein
LFHLYKSNDNPYDTDSIKLTSITTSSLGPKVQDLKLINNPSETVTGNHLGWVVSYKMGSCQEPLLIPIILATQEAEIRRIKVQSQNRQIVRETLS